MKIQQTASLLLTPGPVPVPDWVWEAISQPVMYHRNQAFEYVMHSLQTGLQYLFQTNQLTCGMSGTGTTGMEALLYSLFRKKEKVMFTNFGKFSERWVKYAQVSGIHTLSLDAEWGKTISVQNIMETLEKNPETKGLVLTHCETSSGVLLDIEEISLNVKKRFPEILIVVDGISAIGASPFYFDNWQIDAAAVASQKSLQNPAGTVYFALSEPALDRLMPTHAADCMNLRNYTESVKKLSFPYSPPVNLFYGVNASLAHIRQRTLPVLWNEVHTNAKVFRTAIKKAGWEVFGESPSDTLTAITSVSGSVQDTKKRLYDSGIIVSGGQDRLKGKILRIAHYNPILPDDLSKITEILGYGKS